MQGSNVGKLKKWKSDDYTKTTWGNSRSPACSKSCAGYLTHPSGFFWVLDRFFAGRCPLPFADMPVNTPSLGFASFTSGQNILCSFSGDRLILFTLGCKVLPLTIWINFEGLFSNSCDAVPQGLPSMWPALALASILEDHIDQGSAVQSLDAVVPDWSMTYIPWLLVLNSYHHGSGYDPDILAAGCPWTFRKPH